MTAEMTLLLVQHGDALDKAIDPARLLSEKGRRDVAAIAAFLAPAGVRVQHLLHSGKLRAEQSALALAAVLAQPDAPQPATGLAPNDDVQAFAQALARRNEDTCLVGHLPFMGRLAALLLADDASRELLAFRPGSVACLQRTSSGHWRLNWMLRPELLEKNRPA